MRIEILGKMRKGLVALERQRHKYKERAVAKERVVVMLAIYK